MRIIQLKDLTFGFEIEGGFSTALELNPELEKGEWKSDGSVNFDDENGDRTNEYASRVYTSLPDMLKDLSLFQEPDYKSDFSTGLHLHIGLKDLAAGHTTHNPLWQFAGSESFLLNLHKFATSNELGKLQTERMEQHNYYCKSYLTSKGKVLNSFTSLYACCDKYREVRFHPEFGTLEFRFFYPYNTKQMTKNIKRFITFFLREINRPPKFEKNFYLKPDANIINLSY